MPVLHQSATVPTAPCPEKQFQKKSKPGGKKPFINAKIITGNHQL
jgi:hypothetical protein